MKALIALNPMIWKYRRRLFLGMVFVVFTNIFAVWAPSMIGEGVNALNEANTHFLVPMAEGEAPTLDQLDMPRTCLLYTSPSPRDRQKSRMPSSA